MIIVRCGRCLNCLRHRQGEWLTRFREENKVSHSVYFVTLTYALENRPIWFNSENGESYFSVSREHIKKLHKDMRKRFQQGFFTNDLLKRSGFSDHKDKIFVENCSFKYYVTSEYGSKGTNPHYHGIYWNLPDDLDTVLCLFESLWPYGFVSVYPGSDEATAAYTAKYLINNSLVKSQGLRPFAMMSKGIGKSYLDNDEMLEWHRLDPSSRCYVPIENRKSIMPRYYRDRIFDDEMKFVIAKGTELRSERELRRIDRLSLDQAVFEERLARHLENEDYRQSLWRFQKKNKIK